MSFGVAHTYPATQGTCPAKSETVSLWWSQRSSDHFRGVFASNFVPRKRGEAKMG
ncbi:MAG: hypothetical protein ACPGWR_06825 [Ardenticatenaceae bacterium]